MSDLISRQAAIDALDKIISMNYKDWARAQNAIRQLPSAQIEQRWIPVTERLPENEVTVLVVRKFLGIKDCPAKTYVETAEYCYGDWVADSDEYKIARSKHTDPLYWMPLPEPPKEETHDNN